MMSLAVLGTVSKDDTMLDDPKERQSNLDAHARALCWSVR